MRFFIVLLVPFILAACDTGYNTTKFWRPTDLPSGYAYHQQVYKTQPPPMADSIGYEYSPVRNDTVIEDWQSAADDFILSLIERNDLQPGTIYLEPPSHEDAVYNVLDHALRTALVKAGFAQTASPLAAPLRLSYTLGDPARMRHRWPASYIPDADEIAMAERVAEADTPDKGVFLTASLFVDGVKADELTHLYIVQFYGYEHSSYPWDLHHPVAGGARK